MRYAFLSDVHGHVAKLQAVLADAQARSAAPGAAGPQVVSLGDVGGDDCLALLRGAGAAAVFGNYDVSGWRRLGENRAWVQSWPPMLAGQTFLAVHAAPWWPEGLATLEAFGAWREQRGRSWPGLFPYLSESEDFLWQALAELDTAGKAILFHGHTHTQAVWRCAPDGRLLRIRARAFEIKPEHRYVVGVGSVGVPQDGTGSAYVLYDEDRGTVQMIRIERP